MEAAGLFPVPVFFSEKRDILTGSVTSKEKQTATFSNYGDCISSAIAAVEWQEPQISRHFFKNLRRHPVGTEQQQKKYIIKIK